MKIPRAIDQMLIIEHVDPTDQPKLVPCMNFSQGLYGVFTDPMTALSSLDKRSNFQKTVKIG